MPSIRRVVALAALSACMGSAALSAQEKPKPMAQNPDLDPAVLKYVLPADLHWTQKEDGLQVAVVMGDPSKEGPYIFFAKWAPHHMSRPHYHPHDRYITVISGTWWIGTGDVYQPDRTVPMHAGSFVTHFGRQVHYDGAKDEECIIEIVGDGPAPVVPAERK